jgi:hypothetical protein
VGSTPADSSPFWEGGIMIDLSDKAFGYEGDSGLLEVIKILDKKGFYVTHANVESSLSSDKSETRGYTGYFTIRAIRKKRVHKDGII